MLLNSRSQSPASFAEHYIVESIWKNHFPPGSLLPAERELSELIGVTRTTLREVLQRLSRDGWLTIKHGKPTKVNDYWQTGSLNILDTLARLDDSGSLALVNHLLETRMAIFALYLRSALKRNPKDVIAFLEKANNVTNDADGYIDYDWQLLHLLSRATDNPICTLIMNGFKTLYMRVGKFYYTKQTNRDKVLEFYNELLVLAIANEDIEHIISILWQYGRISETLFQEMEGDMPPLSSLGDDAL